MTGGAGARSACNHVVILRGEMTTSWQSWARETFRDAHIIDHLHESRYQALLANPALLGLELRTLPVHRVVVLDEVQRVPALLNEVHRAIEGTRRRFVLLGFERAPAEDRRYEPAGWPRGAANHVSASAG
jgi:hypothetical protein